MVNSGAYHQDVGEIGIFDVDGNLLEHVLEGEFGILESLNVEVTLFVQFHHGARQAESLEWENRSGLRIGRDVANVGADKST